MMTPFRLILTIIFTTIILSACGNSVDPGSDEIIAELEQRIVELENMRLEEEMRLEENKRFSASFWSGLTVEERTDLMHEDYIQHSLDYKVFADSRGISYKEGYPAKNEYDMQNMGDEPEQEQIDGPTPPPSEYTHLMMAEDDHVLVMRKEYHQTPNEPPGTFYERFYFNLFQLKDGKLYQHWSGNDMYPE